MADGEEVEVEVVGQDGGEEESSLFPVLLSTTLDLVPVVGTIKGAIQLIVGKDLVTGEEVSRGWELAGLIPAGKLVRSLGKLAKVAKQSRRVEESALKQKKVLMEVIDGLKMPKNGVRADFNKKKEQLRLEGEDQLHVRSEESRVRQQAPQETRDPRRGPRTHHKNKSPRPPQSQWLFNTPRSISLSTGSFSPLQSPMEISWYPLSRRELRTVCSNV